LALAPATWIARVAETEAAEDDDELVLLDDVEAELVIVLVSVEVDEEEVVLSVVVEEVMLSVVVEEVLEPVELTEELRVELADVAVVVSDARMLERTLDTLERRLD